MHKACAGFRSAHQPAQLLDFGRKGSRVHPPGREYGAHQSVIVSIVLNNSTVCVSFTILLMTSSVVHHFSEVLIFALFSVRQRCTGQHGRVAWAEAFFCVFLAMHRAAVYV